MDVIAKVAQYTECMINLSVDSQTFSGVIYCLCI